MNDKLIEQLFFERKFAEAIELLKNCNRVRRHGFNGGCRPYKLGIACLYEGDFGRAELLFDRLIEKTIYKISDHFVFAGLARWLQNRQTEAIAIWKEGEKSHYTSLGGLDATLILFFVALHAPDLCNIRECLVRIKERLPDIDSELLASHIGRLLTGRMSEARFREAVRLLWADDTYGEPSDPSANELALAEFYIGLARAKNGDWKGYRECLKRCDRIRYGGPCAEFIIAHYEVQRFRREAKTSASQKKGRVRRTISMTPAKTTSKSSHRKSAR